MEQVIEILKNNQAEAFANLEAKNFVLIEKRPGSEQPTQRSRSIIQGSISNQVSSEKFGNIMVKLDELGIDADISQALESGAPFEDYGQLDNVFDEGKTHLKHTPGEVLLVDVWATWCGPCQRPMQHNQEMLVKNETAWAGKVRIVGVSVDDAKDIIQKRVESKGWAKVQHLTLLGWNNDHKLIKDFSISGIPFICLVDKFGKINYTGHPSSIPLEARINQLIAQQKQEIKVEAAPTAPEQAQNDGEKLTALLTVQNIKHLFPTSQLLCLKGGVDLTFDKGKKSSKASVEIFAYEHDKQALAKAKEVFGGLKGVELTVNQVKTIQVPYPENPVCWECHAALTFPYYWLYWEQGTHFGCVDCIQKASAEPNHHFRYEKNSILLVDKWQRVSLKRLGHNLQPEDVTKVESGHMFGCNGCGGSSGLGQARYICIGCRSEPNFRGDYVDLCGLCKQKVVKGDEEVMKQLQNEHHLKGHPLLRVLYSVKGYYEF